MFIIHGTKRVEKKLGLVADFCPVCHRIRCFELKRISLVKHLYYIPLGEGKILDHTITCLVCGVLLGCNLSDYKKMEKRSVYRNDVEALIHSTFPGLRERYAGRLTFEEQLKKNPGAVEPADRAQYTFELFRLLNSQVVACFKRETRFDMQSGVGCLGSLVLFGALIAIGLSFRDNTPQQDWTVIAAITVLVSGMIYTLAQLALVPRRVMRNRIIPRLARGLVPLDPLQGELAAVLQKCKSTDLLIGKKLDLARLTTELGKQRKASLL